MPAEAALVVFVVGLAGEALTSLDQSLERALGSLEAVGVVAVEHLPRDVDALEQARARQSSAIVEIVTDAALDRADLRVCPVGIDGTGGCQDRSLAFGTADTRAERERAIGIVAIAMLPEATRQAAASGSPAPGPAPSSAPSVPAAAPSTATVPVVAPARFEAELAFAAAIGAPSSWGGAAAARVRLFQNIWLRAGAGARFGTLASIQARTVELPLSIGLDARWDLGRSVSVGARADARVQSRAVALEGATPEHRQRWLAAFQTGPELHVRLSKHAGAVVFAGIEVGAGRTEIQRTSGASTQLGLVRACFEVGPHLTF